MKPDWKKEKEAAEEEVAKAREAVRPNFMSQKKEKDAVETAAETTEAPTDAQVSKPNWQEQTGKAEPAAEAEAPAIDPEVVPMPEPAPVPEQPAVPEMYTVQSGDSLSAIAQRIYGDGNFWVDIWKLNQGQIPDPNVIRPGQELKLPPVP